MPRLPSAQDLGQRRIAESGRPLAQWETGAPLRATEGLGRSIAGAGQQFDAIAARQDAEASRLADTDARSGWLTRTMDFDKQFEDTDPEFAKWPEKAQPELARIRDEEAAKIRDPNARQQFVMRTDVDIAKRLSGLNERVKVRDNDTWWSTKNQELQKLQEAAYSEPDETKRAEHIRTARDVIRAARVRGMIKSDTDEAETARKWEEGYRERGLWQLPPLERIDALRGPVKDTRDGAMRIVGAESAFNATAKNPNSTATGAGQFIEDTWLNTIKKHRPDLYNGKSREEVLALRKNYDVAVEMTQRHLEDNISAIKSAGHEPTLANGYLAHFAGVGGAKALLSSDEKRDAATVMAEASGGSTSRAALIRANPFLEGMTVSDIKAWSARKMGGGRAGTLAAGISADRRQALIGAAEKEHSDNVRQEGIAAERQRAAWVDQTQFAASKGQYSVQDAERDFQSGAFKNFEEFNGVKKLAEGYEQSTAALDTVVGVLREGGVLNPRDPSHKKGLEALDAQTGLTDALAKTDGEASTQAAQMFGRTGMIPDRQKGLLEGMIRSGDARQLEYTMTTLDQMYRRNPEAFNQAFSKDTFATLQMWQSRVDQKPEVFREELTRAMDPANIKAVEAREKRGREIVAKMEDKDIIKVFDESYIPFNNPTAPVSTRETGIDVLRNEYAELYSQGYARLGDEAKAKEFADARIKMTWGSSKAGGGRLMKYAPEALTDILPKFGGDPSWMEKQVLDYVSTVRKGSPRLEVDLATGGVKPTARGIDYALVALPNTKAEIDNLRAGGTLAEGRKSPAWRVVYIDPDTAELKDGGMFSFDVDKARAEYEAKWREQRVKVEEENERMRSVPLEMLITRGERGQ